MFHREYYRTGNKFSVKAAETCICIIHQLVGRGVFKLYKILKIRYRTESMVNVFQLCR